MLTPSSSSCVALRISVSPSDSPSGRPSVPVPVFTGSETLVSSDSFGCSINGGSKEAMPGLSRAIMFLTILSAYVERLSSVAPLEVENPEGGRTSLTEGLLTEPRVVNGRYAWLSFCIPVVLGCDVRQILRLSCYS